MNPPATATGQAPSTVASSPTDRNTTTRNSVEIIPANSPGVNWMGHWYKADKRYDLVLEVARDYALLHPGIKVNLQFPERIVGANKLAVAHLIVQMIQTNRIDWDIVWMDDFIYRFVAEELNDPQWGRKYLVDFEQVPGFIHSQKPFIIDDPTFRNQTGGILVGPYIEGYYHALYYNKDLADRVGLSIKPFGMTFDDLLSYIQATDAYNRTAKEKIPIFYEAADMSGVGVMFQNLTKSWMADYAEASSEQCTARKLEAMRMGLDAFEKLGKYKPLIPSYRQNAWFETRGLPLDDKAMFFVSGTWMYSRWRDIDVKKAAKMVPVELPVFRKVDYCLGGAIPTWAVMKNSPHRDAAVGLLMSWSTPKVAERWVRYTKTPTGVAGNVSEATLGGDPYEVFQRTMLEKYGSRFMDSTNAAYLLGKDNSLLQKDVIDVLHQLLEGKINADEAEKQIRDKMR